MEVTWGADDCCSDWTDKKEEFAASNFASKVEISSDFFDLKSANAVYPLFSCTWSRLAWSCSASTSFALANLKDSSFSLKMPIETEIQLCYKYLSFNL